MSQDNLQSPFKELMLQQCIAECAPGVPFNTIGNTIAAFCEAHGYGTVREFTGHGVGRDFHELPVIYHFGQ